MRTLPTTAKVGEFFRKGCDCPDEISGCVFYETLPGKTLMTNAGYVLRM
jgi:hypothetical protein